MREGIRRLTLDEIGQHKTTVIRLRGKIDQIASELEKALAKLDPSTVKADAIRERSGEIRRGAWEAAMTVQSELEGYRKTAQAQRRHYEKSSFRRTAKFGEDLAKHAVQVSAWRQRLTGMDVHSLTATAQDALDGGNLALAGLVIEESNRPTSPLTTEQRHEIRLTVDAIRLPPEVAKVNRHLADIDLIVDRGFSATREIRSGRPDALGHIAQGLSEREISESVEQVTS